MCRKRLGKEAARASEVVDEGNSFYIGAVTCTDSIDAWRVQLTIAGNAVMFKIDTGADVPKLMFKSLPQKPHLQPPSTKLSSPGDKLHTIGQFQATTSVKGNAYHFRIIVVEQLTNCLLSRSAAEQMGLVTHIEEVS